MKALIVFVKTPVAGTVKTRLQARLSPEKVVNLYTSFISETLAACVRVRGVDRFMGCTPATDHDFLREVSEIHGMRRFKQRGRDLGEKIVNAIRDHFKKGYERVVIIGSDSPTIPVEYIRKAFLELDRNDIVLGPCCDGGLYLVGAREDIKPGIFRGIPWDTGEVLNRTLENIAQMDIDLALLPFWYDVDVFEDLRFLENHRAYLGRKGRKQR